MKSNCIACTFVGFLFLGILSGCSEPKVTTLVNTLTFETENFDRLRLDYDADDIYVLKNDNDKMIIKEYMNENKKSYYARTSIQNGELLVTEGNRPRHSRFESYIEISIPKNYIGSLSMHSTSGTIHSKIPLSLSGDFSVDTTSGVLEVSTISARTIKASSANGTITFDTMNADEITIQTTNATTSMNETNGKISYQSKGGKLVASNLHGSGSFTASGEGSITISYAEITSNVFVYSKNGTLSVVLPSELDFKFSAITKKGSIDTSFSDQLSTTDCTATGTVGTSPNITIELETRNGNIKVLR